MLKFTVHPIREPLGTRESLTLDHFALRHQLQVLSRGRKRPVVKNRERQDWKTFLKNHAHEIVSRDFLTVPTITCQMRYMFLMVENSTRRIVHFNVTARQLITAFPWDTSPRSPRQNPYLERLIGTVWRYFLDHVIVLNERHLNGVPDEYISYYKKSLLTLGWRRNVRCRELLSFARTKRPARRRASWAFWRAELSILWHRCRLRRRACESSCTSTGVSLLRTRSLSRASWYHGTSRRACRWSPRRTHISDTRRRGRGGTMWNWIGTHAGARVIATVRSDHDRAVAERAGAHHVVDTRAQGRRPGGRAVLHRDGRRRCIALSRTPPRGARAAAAG